jgi:hypothetical protein
MHAMQTLLTGYESANEGDESTQFYRVLREARVWRPLVYAAPRVRVNLPLPPLLLLEINCSSVRLLLFLQNQFLVAVALIPSPSRRHCLRLRFESCFLDRKPVEFTKIQPSVQVTATF